MVEAQAGVALSSLPPTLPIATTKPATQGALEMQTDTTSFKDVNPTKRGSGDEEETKVQEYLKLEHELKELIIREMDPISQENMKWEKRILHIAQTSN